MMIKKIFLLSGILLFTALVSLSPVQSQSLLTLEEAVSTGLENNYNIRLYTQLLDIADNNRTLGNAGFLPILNTTASMTERVEDSDFVAGGEARSTEEARNSAKSASLDLNWTLFDGFRMFRAYDRLGVLREVRDEELRLEMEFLVAQITLSYNNIIRINEQLKTLQTNIEVSQERIEIEETKVDLGSGSEYDLLQARSDLNADRAAFLRESNRLTEAKIVLNELMSRPPNREYDVISEIYINRELKADELYQKLLTENRELSIARMNKDLRRIELKEIRGERLPEISLNTGYRYSRNENDGGFIRFNETTGFSVGLTARLNLFDGFNANRRAENAQIEQKSAEISYQQNKLRLESDFYSVYSAYLNAIELVDLEEENLLNAEETLDIALERFRLGTISSLEFREAQRTFIQAENRLINAKYEAKVAETELLQLSGELGTIFM